MYMDVDIYTNTIRKVSKKDFEVLKRGEIVLSQTKREEYQYKQVEFEVNMGTFSVRMNM